MLIYVLLPPLILLLGIPVYLFPKELKKLYSLAMFLLLALLMGLRDITVGTDHQLYSDLFMEYGKRRFTSLSIDTKAPVYDALCRLVSAVAPYSEVMTFILALLICSGVMIYFYRFSDDMVMSVYCYVSLYFYCTSFNATRQYLAVALVSLSVCMLDKGRRKTAALVFLIAAGIHITSLTMLPFLLLFNWKFTKKRLSVLLYGTIFATVGARFFFPLMMRVVAAVLPVYYETYMMAYSKHQVLTESGRGNNIYLTIFYLVFFLYAAFVLWRQLHVRESICSHIAKLFPFCCVAIIIGLGFAENLALNRINFYFQIAMCCMIPNILGYIGNGRLAAKAAVYVITLLPYYICLSRNLSGVVPYRFFW